MDGPFEILGIEPDADESAIERAYRERVKETHPDLGGSREEFLRVRAAYEAVSVGETVDRPGIDGARPDDRRARPEDVTGGNGDRWNGDGAADGERSRTSTVEYLDYAVVEEREWRLDDEDLFEKAAAAGLDDEDFGRISVPRDVPLLKSAEHCGFTWPYACRGGACANCAVAVTAGELEMPVSHVLPPSMTDRGFRLSCIGTPTTEELSVVFNVKHRPALDELRLPPHRFERAHAGD